MRDADAQLRYVLCLLRDCVDELLERLAVAAHSLDGYDLALSNREDRLHVHQLPGECFRAPDAAAAREELERVNREEQTVLAQIALDERVDLIVGRPALEPALNRSREHRRGNRGALGVDRSHPAVSELRGGSAGALERAGEIRCDVDREDAFVGAELLVGRQEIAGRRLRRGRQLGRRAEPLVELCGRKVDTVPVTVGPEVDVQRDDAPIRVVILRVGEICSRVDDDRRVLRGELHPAPSAARFTASTMSSSSWSFVRHAVAPAA